MKAAAFRYLRAGSREEAIGALTEHGDAAKVLAGGQSLLTLMNFRLAQPEVLVDIGRAGLSGVSANGALRIGATTTQNAALRDPEVARRAPLLSRALRDVAHHTLRNRGTVGGSIAHADPAAELPAALVALGGSVTVHGPAGERTIAADHLFATHYTTTLADDELLTSVDLPAQAPDAWAFHEISRRSGDFAIAGVAATFATRADRTVTSARVVLFAVDERPLRIDAVEQALIGRPLGDDATIAEAADVAARAVEPIGDIHGSGAFRKRLAGVAVRRGLQGAATTNGSRA